MAQAHRGKEVLPLLINDLPFQSEFPAQGDDPEPHDAHGQIYPEILLAKDCLRMLISHVDHSIPALGILKGQGDGRKVQ